MSEEENKKREEIINTELDLIYNGYDMGLVEMTKSELKELRYLANDFEEVVNKVATRILKETDMKEDDDGFIDAIQVVIYAYYNMLYIVDMYVKEEDFEGLVGQDFKQVWDKVSTEDKEIVISTYLRIEDIMVLVYGMHLLLSQLENKR